MRAAVWLLRAFLFFALFAFALNNQQETVVHWFFGFDWRAPMVVVVLAAFVAGCAVGVLAMTPAWWRQRRAARQHGTTATAAPSPAPAPAPVPSQFGAEAAFPPREVL
ncbi:MAG TPA: lipopolysaccharide assembly protein LapA domain-containing protein [Burkholderiaceae bacterium]|nr:lipopolysaccharide assembly protein LapA domain-containing protein [Burkholderiaceae bacterium]